MTAPVTPPPPPFGRFFLPGPTDVHPEVLAAMQRPMIGHRSGAMEQLLQKMAGPLRALCRTRRDVLIGAEVQHDIRGVIENEPRRQDDAEDREP